MSRREQAKDERRRRIVAAARDLIKETGNAGLSMRAIAARADVALTTPYKLFGSKRAVVIALLEDIREFQEHFSQQHRVGVIDRVFQAVSISLAYLAEDPDFYRTLWTEALRFDGKALRRELRTPRYDFWCALLGEARREGAMLADIAIDPLLRALDAVYVAAMLGWVLGDIDVRALEAHVGYGYALALRGAATGAHRDQLERRLLDCQRELARRREDAVAA